MKKELPRPRPCFGFRLWQDRIVQQPLCFLIGCRILNPVRVESPIGVDIRQIREPAMDGRIWILCRIPAIEDKTLTDNKRNLPAIGIEAVTALNGSRTRKGRRCKLTAIGLELDIVLPSQRIIEVDKDRPSRCLLKLKHSRLSFSLLLTIRKILPKMLLAAIISFIEFSKHPSLICRIIIHCN